MWKTSSKKYFASPPKVYYSFEFAGKGFTYLGHENTPKFIVVYQKNYLKSNLEKK